jgi:SpoVK/Ycf46/Vps4 family AAA+-type ATPase
MVPLPDLKTREHFFKQQHDHPFIKDDATCHQLAQDTAGLDQHAMEQLCLSSKYENRKIDPKDLNKLLQQKIEESLGPDVIDFKQPGHGFADLIGNTHLMSFIKSRLIPRLLSPDPSRALPGFAVSGPIRGGKTFIFEAVAAELGIPVITLKSIRSQWFGQTDVIIEKLTTLLSSLGKAMIFVDEADTQFGSLHQDSHETEKRLTGKFQQIMSDPKFKGKLIWVLVTARIDRLSPDIRGPGRAGGLIIPVLDPVGQDLKDYLNWMVQDTLKRDLNESELNQLMKRMDREKSYAGSIMALKAELEDERVHLEQKELTFETILTVVERYLPPPIEKTRRKQTLLALLNCTRKDLIPKEYCPEDIDKQREIWQEELAQLQ